MTLIDSLAKSETYKRKSYFFLLRNFKKNFKTALFRATTKTKVFVRFDCFVIVLLMGNWEWK